MDAYFTVKVLSNNALLAGKEGKEYVLMGNGLGFGVRTGDIVNLNKVEKTFLFMKHETLKKYQQLLEYIPENIMAVSEEIISMVRKSSGTELDENIHIALADHIHFLVTRLNQNIDIVNPFMKEISVLYPEEYQLAEKAVVLMSEKLHLKITEGEVGFIALHIHSAKVRNSVSETLKNTKLYQKCIDIIEEHAKVKIDSNSINYARMITHLRFAIERLRSNTVEKNVLLDSIRVQFPKEYEIAVHISDYIERTLGFPVSEDEVGYLTIHINRVIKNEKIK